MPNLNSNDTTIPIIDISNPNEETARQVLEAASTHGFLFIKNDGITIPPKDIDEMFHLSKSFFSSPESQKAEYAIHTPKAGGINRGWVRMAGESLDPEGQKQGDPKEAFNISPPQPDLQPLPSPLHESKDLILRFQTACHTLCTRILSLLGAALYLKDPEYFASRHDQTLGPSGTIFRMLYYPSITTSTPSTSTPSTSTPSTSTSKTNASQQSIRAGAHSDYGTLTLLFRLPGQPGLELLSPATGTWIPVPVNPTSSSPNPTEGDTPKSATPSSPPILVNIGDLLSFWTAGALKSTVHRVVFSGAGEERYSMAYFCHPLDEARLESVESSVLGGDVEELGRQRRRLGMREEGEGDGDGDGGVLAMTAKEHLLRRLEVTYGL